MADDKKLVKILKQVPLFTGLDDRQLGIIAGLLIKREFEPEKIIITQGQGGQGLFIISDGSAKVIRSQPDGVEVEVNLLGPNDFFGELALLDDGVRTASVIATTKLECLVLTRLDFQGILRTEPDMAISLLKEMAKRFRKALDTL
jgi:CRP-like cAMP-binding protein